MREFRKVLVYVDAEQESTAALREAMHLVREGIAAVTVVDVVPEVPSVLHSMASVWDDVEDMMLEDRRELLEQKLAEVGLATGDVTIKVLHGPPARRLAKEAEEGGYDLVVKGAYGVSPDGRPRLSSVAVRLMRACACPIWIVQPADGARSTGVTAAVDPFGKPGVAVAVLTMAAGFAAEWGVPLHAVSAYETVGDLFLRRRSPTEADRYVEEARARHAQGLHDLLRQAGLDPDAVRVHLIAEEPVAAISRFVNDARMDLLVVGTVARHGIPGLVLGNTAEALLGTVETSLLVVRPKTAGA